MYLRTPDLFYSYTLTQTGMTEPLDRLYRFSRHFRLGPVALYECQ